MRFLVTGGCGFIGSAVVRGAVEGGHQVLSVDRRKRTIPCPSLAAVNGKPGFARLEADVCDRAMMRALVAEFRPEAVIHLAAPADDQPESLFDVSVAGAFSVLEACRRHLDKVDDETREAFRFVHALHAIPEGATPGPRDAAAAGAAGLIAEWGRALDIARVTCTGPDLYGPWQRADAPVPAIVNALLEGQQLVLPQGGEGSRDLLHVADFAGGLIAAATKAEAHSDYAFTAYAERRDADLADALCAILDARAPRPDGRPHAGLVRLSAPPARQLAPPAMLDASAAEHDLGWAPTGFHEGLDRAVRWALANRSAAAGAGAQPH